MWQLAARHAPASSSPAVLLFFAVMFIQRGQAVFLYFNF